MTKKCRCKSDQTNANVISQVFLVLSSTHLSCYVNHKLFMLRNVPQLKKQSKKEKKAILTCKFKQESFLGNMSSLFPVLSSFFSSSFFSFLFLVLPFFPFFSPFFFLFPFFFLPSSFFFSLYKICTIYFSHQASMYFTELWPFIYTEEQLQCVMS